MDRRAKVWLCRYTRQVAVAYGRIPAVEHFLNNVYWTVLDSTQHTTLGGVDIQIIPPDPLLKLFIIVLYVKK